MSVSSTWCRNLSHSYRGQFLSTMASPAMKCSLNVAMARLAALTQCLWGRDKVNVHFVGCDVHFHHF
jgi:hypothetical protein